MTIIERIHEGERKAMENMREEFARELYREFQNGRANPGYTPFDQISVQDQNGWRTLADNVMKNTGLTTGVTELKISSTVDLTDFGLEPNVAALPGHTEQNPVAE